MKEIEKEIAALETEEAELNEQLALPEVTADYQTLSSICARLEEIHAKTDGLYEEYETLI